MGERGYFFQLELVKKSSRAKEGRVPPERRSVSPGAKRREALKGRVSRMRRATGVYIEIPGDPEHRRNARSRAQQIFSQALRG